MGAPGHRFPLFFVQYRFPLFFAQRDDKEKEVDRSRFNPHSFLGAQVTQPIFNHHLQKKSHHISLKTALVQYWPSTSNGSATVPVILLKYNVNDKKLPSKGTTWDLKWQRQSYTLTKVWGALLLPCKGSPHFYRIIWEFLPDFAVFWVILDWFKGWPLMLEKFPNNPIKKGFHEEPGWYNQPPSFQAPCCAASFYHF